MTFITSPQGVRPSGKSRKQVHRLILMACVGLWLLQQLLPSITLAYSLQPQEILQRPETLLTSIFLHSPHPAHILMNMVALLVLGPLLEEDLGSLHFLAAYLITGVAGGLAYVLLGGTGPAVGASGAIFGLLGMALPLTRLQGKLVALVLLNLLLGMALPGVGWQAHLGGLLAGMAWGAVVYWQLPLQAAFKRMLARASGKQG